MGFCGFCIRLPGVVSPYYPITKYQKAALYTSVALAVSLFVVNCLTLSGINIPSIGWINLGLSLGSGATGAGYLISLDLPEDRMSHKAVLISREAAAMLTIAVWSFLYAIQFDTNFSVETMNKLILGYQTFSVVFLCMFIKYIEQRNYNERLAGYGAAVVPDGRPVAIAGAPVAVAGGDPSQSPAEKKGNNDPVITAPPDTDGFDS